MPRYTIEIAIGVLYNTTRDITLYDTSLPLLLTRQYTYSITALQIRRKFSFYFDTSLHKKLYTIINKYM